MNLSPDFQKFLEDHKDKKIVFTNGCFDILHPGHLSYLNEAKSLGDVLVIGLNSDESVRRLKGPDRPVNNENDRKFMLLNLKSVDWVEFFDDDTPYELIKNTRPSILVKGGDWAVEQIVGHDLVLANGGKVLSLSFKNGYSTTDLIKNLQGRR